MENKDKYIQIPEGFSEDLTISDPQDVNLFDISRKFISILEEKYKEYKEKFKILDEENKKYLNNENYLFYPEKLNKKSPTTIINAPWGTGKTFFIEKLIKNLIDNNVNLEIFKNVIIIDAWRHSTHDNIPNELINEILLKLFETLSKDEKKITQIEKIFEKCSKFILNSFINAIKDKTHLDFKNIEENKENEKSLNEISKKIKPTIVFIDNIERVGPNSWEIMKALVKLSQIDNLILVLPMHIRMLDNNTISNNEYSIEKYIDITYFNLKQDYYSLFINENITDNEKEIMSNIFKHQNNGKNLSLREVVQRLESNKIFSIKNEYEKYFTINNKIWPSEVVFKESIINDINKYIEILNELDNSYKKLINNFEECFSLMIKYDKVKEILNEANLLSDEQKLHFYDISSYEEELKNISNVIEKTKSYFDEEIRMEETRIIEHKNNIAAKEEGVNEQQKQFETARIKYNQENEKSLDKKDQEEIVMHERVMTNAKRDIDLEKENIKELRTEINRKEKNIGTFNENMNLIVKELDEFNKNKKFLENKEREFTQFNSILNGLRKEISVKESKESNVAEEIFELIKNKFHQD